MIIFATGEYTLFSADGTPLPNEHVKVIGPMVEESLSLAEYVDIELERLAVLRKVNARSCVVRLTFMNSGTLTAIDEDGELDGFSGRELLTAADGLVAENLLEIPSAGIYAIPVKDTDLGPSISPDVYLTLFRGPVDVGLLESTFYLDHINPALLRDIGAIQAGMEFSAESTDDLVYLLKVSPTALARALVPMDMIVNGRRQGVVHDAVDQFHLDYFHQHAIESLRTDFLRRAFGHYYHEYLSLREIETATRVSLKSASKVEYECEVNERLRVGPADEALGGGYVVVSALKETPQPWEPHTVTEVDEERSQN